MVESSYGTWWHPDTPETTVAGQFIVEPLNAVKVDMLEASDHMYLGDRTEDGPTILAGGETVRMLHGNVAGVGWVTLLGCEYGGVSFGYTWENTVVARIAVTGVHLDSPDDPAFRRLEVTMPALEALLRPFPVKPVKHPSARAKRVTLALDDRRRRWADGDVTITWEYQRRIHPQRTGTNVQMVPFLTLESSTGRPISEWFDRWLIPINALVELAANYQSRPASVAAFEKRRPSTDDRLTYDVQVLAAGIGANEYVDKFPTVLATAESIDAVEGGLPAVLEHIRDQRRTQRVFFDLLSDVVRDRTRDRERPLRNRYLDLTSALEAYDTQLNGLGPIEASRFKEQRTAALGELVEPAVTKATRRFVKDWLPSRSSYSLEKRLHRLAKSAGVSKWRVSPATMASLRNDIAHGNTDTDRREISDAFKQALDLGRRLGLGPAALPVATMDL